MVAWINICRIDVVRDREHLEQSFYQSLEALRPIVEIVISAVAILHEFTLPKTCTLEKELVDVLENFTNRQIVGLMTLIDNTDVGNKFSLDRPNFLEI